MKHKYLLLVNMLCMLHVSHVYASVIAHNLDNSLVLTEQQLQQWLANHQALSKQDLASQVNAYFLEKYLYQQLPTLSQEKRTEIEFNQQRKLYQQTTSYYKKESLTQIKIEQQQYDTLLADLVQKNSQKKTKVRLYQIFKKYPENATAEIKIAYFKQLQSLRHSITDLDSFKKIAALESDSQSRLKMGLIGNVYQGLFNPELDAIVMNLQVDELSEVIKTEQGLMLFYCAAHIAPHIMSADEMHTAVTNALNSQAKDQLWQKLTEKILADTNLHIDWSLLNSTNQQDIIAGTKNSSVNLQQLKWMLKDKTELTIQHKNSIQAKLENYFIGQYLYGNLKQAQQNLLQQKNHQAYVDAVTSAVLLHLIKKVFIAPTEQQLQQHYEQNKAQYFTQPRFDVSFISLAVNPSNRASVYAQANKIFESLTANPNAFAQFTKQQAKSSVQSVPENQLGSVFGFDVAKQILWLDNQEISKPVESDKGLLWIVRLDKKHPKQPMSFAQAKPLIDKKLGSFALEQTKTAVIDQLIVELGIVIDAD